MVCGTTGEAPTLSAKEKIECVSAVCDAVRGRVPVIAGTTTNDTASSVQLSREAVREERFVNFTRNDMFIEEVRRFLNYVKTRKQETLSLDDGLGSLKIALAIKESMSLGLPVKLQK